MTKSSSSFPFYIAKRYLFSKSSTNAINIITLIATIGVVIGSLALFIVLSGFSGIINLNMSLFNVSDPDIKITPVKGKSFLFTPQIKKILDEEDGITAYSKEIDQRVFLKYKEKNHIANIKGVDENYQQTVAIDSAIIVGTWIDKDYNKTVVIGNGISNKLSLGVYNTDKPLDIYVPKAGKGLLNPNNAFKSVSTQVIGIYSGLEEFQNKYVFSELEVAQKLLNYKSNQISSIVVKLKNPDSSDLFNKEFSEKIGSEFKVQTREQLNALAYKVMNTEQFVTYLIFTLIVIIALFNVIGAIIMMIIDKRDNLKTLLNLGMNEAQIKRIFVLQGFMLTVLGMLVGLTIGVLLVLFQTYTGFFMITPTLPYPVEFKLSNLLLVMVTIVSLGYIAAKIASSRISKDFIVK